MNKKIAYLSILIRSLSYALFRGRAKEITDKPKAIAVFQLAQLGDIVCTTPVFRAIKNKYPDAHLYVIGQPIFEELLRDNTDVDEYIPYSTFEGTLEKLKTLSLDYSISVAPSFSAAALGYLSGAKAVIVPEIVGGFSPNATLLYKILSTLVIMKLHRIGSYVPREYLRLLEPLNIISENTKKYLGHSPAAAKKVEDFFSQRGITLEDLIVGISPSSGNKIKNWGVDRFARVADYIYQNYRARIIILGGPADADEVTSFMESLNPGTPVINTLKLFSIDELKALIAKMSILIAVDTGPIYIAEAYGVKTIDIVGPVDDREQPPQSPRNLIVKWEGRKEAALHIMNARIYDYEEARRQVDMITVDQVIAAFEELIK